jgi:hypothetical protein
MNDTGTVPMTRQAAAIPGRSRRGAVTGKLKTAIDLMIWSGEKRAVAAEQAGLADSSLRFAMRKLHVMAYYNSELAALRLSLRARNLHRLDSIADSSRNDQARVASIKVLEQIADTDAQHNRPGDNPRPGVVIVIQQPSTPAAGNSPGMITIEPTPAILTP